MVVGNTDHENPDHEKCIKQFALNVAKNVRFLSNLQKVGQFIAKNAMRKEGEDISFLKE